MPTQSDTQDIFKLVKSSCPKVQIRRQWNDWRIAEIEFSKLSDIAWDRISGGVKASAPQYFIHAYVRCNEYTGDPSRMQYILHPSSLVEHENCISHHIQHA